MGKTGKPREPPGLMVSRGSVRHADAPRFFVLCLGQAEDKKPLIHCRRDLGAVHRRIEIKYAAVIRMSNLAVEAAVAAGAQVIALLARKIFRQAWN